MFNINFQEPDTKSLLDLVNYTNPDTIGKLLTYEDIDIRDFRFSTEYRIGKDDYFVEYLGKKYVAPDIAALASTVGLSVDIVSTLYAKNLNPEYVESSALLFNSYDKGVYKDINWSWDNGFIIPEVTGDSYPILYTIGLTSTNPSTNVGSIGADFVIDANTDYSKVQCKLQYTQYGLGPLLTIRELNNNLVLNVFLNQRRKSGGGYIRTEDNIVLDALVNSDDVLNFSVKSSITIRTLTVEIVNKSTGEVITRRYNIYNGKVGLHSRDITRFGHNGNPAVKMKPTKFNSQIPVERWMSLSVGDGISLKIIKGDWFDFNGLSLDGFNILEGTVTESPYNAVTLVNRAYEKDTVDVSFERIALTDVVDMSVDSDSWNWYDSDEWDQARDIPLAVQMLRDRVSATGINVDGNLRNIQVVRTREGKYWYLTYTFDSLVFGSGTNAKFKMPHQFSDSVTVRELNGFIYSPIKLVDIVV